MAQGAGTQNEIGFAENFDFSGKNPPSELNGLQANGQLWIGRSTNNANGTQIDVATLTPGTGISITNGPGSITIANTGIITQDTITGDTGGALTPNWSILGQQAGSVAVMDTVGTGPSTLRVEDRAWLTQIVVDPSATVGLRGTYQTITAALAAASSGQTIFLRPGTYTENFSLKAGVNICGWPSDGTSGSFRQSQMTYNVKIVGKMSFSSAGSCCISNVFIQTNSDNFLAITGTAASNVLFKNCYLYCSNNTGIASSSTLSNIEILNCSGDLGTTGIAYFALSGGGNLDIDGGVWGNSGSSTTASTWSAGILSIRNCEFDSFVTSSGSSSLGAYFYNVFFNNSAANTTVLTHGNSSGQQIAMWNCQVLSGTASSINLSHASANLFINECEIGSSNTNAITGTGAIEYGVLTFSSTSSTINAALVETYDYTQVGAYRAQGQPAFSAYLSASTANNVTGDNTQLFVPYNAELYDVDAWFDATTGIATVKTPGKYLFTVTTWATNLGAAHNLVTSAIVTTGANFYHQTSIVGSASTQQSISHSVECIMAATDTAKVLFGVAGSTKTVGILSAGATDPRSIFTGRLIS